MSGIVLNLSVYPLPVLSIGGVRHWQPVWVRKSIEFTILRRGIWAGAPRHSGLSNTSVTSSNCLVALASPISQRVG